MDALPATVASRLSEGARTSFNFVVLVVASSAIATFGLLENNAAVIIGAMIIAPLIVPIQALSFGAIAGNRELLGRAAISVAVGTILSIAVAVTLELLVSLPTLGSEILARSKPNLLDLGIALAAGSVSGFATVRPSISATIAGTAIAVALMPPICVIGIAIAAGQGHLALGAFLLYATNLFGITLACMIVFRLAGHVKSADRTAFITAAVLTAILAVPLGAGLVELLRYDRLESALSTALRTQTVTFRHVELIQMRVDWLKSPPVATLTVRSTQAISPAQVSDLEQFARERTGQKFTLVFEVTPLVEVHGATPPPD
jgi:uncharacterized hydrophobic protein (TIGR00271 family)